MNVFENGPSYTQSDSTMIPKWSSSDPKLPPYTQNNPKTAISRSEVRSIGVLRPVLTLQKSFKNQYFFNIFAFRPHQARTYMRHTCLIPAIRRLYAQSCSEVTPKWSQSGHKATFIYQKLCQSDPKATPTQPQSFITSLSRSN